jgi:hypothetical protein
MVRLYGVFLVAAVGSAMATSACADVWGLDNLSVGDAVAPSGGDDGTSPETGPALDGEPPSMDGGDAANPPSDATAPGDATDGAVSGDSPSGTCLPDPTIACGASDTAYSGFSCTGTAQPSSAFPGVTCLTQGTSGGTTTFCCKGAWCQELTMTSCDSCFAASCGAPDCLCANLGSPVDDAGDTACFSYVICVFNCNGSLSQCQSSCAGGYSAQATAAGNADLACGHQYCGGPCNL